VRDELTCAQPIQLGMVSLELRKPPNIMEKSRRRMIPREATPPVLDPMVTAMLKAPHARLKSSVAMRYTKKWVTPGLSPTDQ